jgi:hypothetical protein
MPAGPAITPQIAQLLGPLLANHERIERYRAIAIKRAAGGRGRTVRRAAPRTLAFYELQATRRVCVLSGAPAPSGKPCLPRRAREAREREWLSDLWRNE